MGTFGGMGRGPGLAVISSGNFGELFLRIFGTDGGIFTLLTDAEMEGMVEELGETIALDTVNDDGILGRFRLRFKASD